MDQSINLSFLRNLQETRGGNKLSYEQFKINRFPHIYQKKSKSKLFYVLFILSYCPQAELISPCKCENYGLDPNGTMSLECDQLSLLDEDMSEILNSFIVNCKNISLLRHLSARYNYLTQIPPEIRLFPSLTLLNFHDNKISSIKADDFNFSSLAIGDEDRILLYLSTT